MSDYPFFIPQVVLFANSSLFWFKVANEHREFRNYLYFLFHLPFISAVRKHITVPLCPPTKMSSVTLLFSFYRIFPSTVNLRKYLSDRLLDQ